MLDKQRLKNIFINFKIDSEQQRIANIGPVSIVGQKVVSTAVVLLLAFVQMFG